MSEDWTATVAAERMATDQEFADRVAASSFDKQQWGLVMTALEFEIENPSDPEAARIRADCSSLDAVMDELDRVGGGPPGAVGGGGGGDGGGLLDSVTEALGFGDSGDDRTPEAEELAAEYAERLQATLEKKGRWDEVRQRAQG